MGKEEPGVEMRESWAEMQVRRLLLRLHARTRKALPWEEQKLASGGRGAGQRLGEGAHGKSNGSKSSLRLPPRGGVHVPPLDSVHL